MLYIARVCKKTQTVQEIGLASIRDVQMGVEALNALVEFNDEPLTVELRRDVKMLSTRLKEHASVSTESASYFLCERLNTRQMIAELV